MPPIHHPRQVVLVSSRAEVPVLGRKTEKDDIITIAWHSPVSFDPDLYMISVGKTRFSAKLIRESHVFVVNFIPFILKKQVIFCGTNSGEFIDKFKESGLIKEEAEKVDCPRIKEALGYLECKVVDAVEAGDHILFIGKVLNSEFKQKRNRLFQEEKDFTTTK